MSEVSNQVEALLFSSGRAMNVEDVTNIMNLEKKEVKKALKELKERYDSSDGSIMLIQEGDSWKLSIKEKYVSLVTKIVADTEMSKTVLETLSVIAWKSPVLQSEVIKIRTSNAYEHIKELVDAGFINKEREGRSYRLRIAEKFFEYFDVPGDKGIKDAFKEVKIPEKKEPEHLGMLEVIPIEEHKEGKNVSENEAEEKFDTKEEIPPIDEEFLSKVNKQIETISAKNDELEQDELFKRKTDDTEESQEVDEVTSEEESVDEYVEEKDSLVDDSQEESSEQSEEEFVEEELTEEKKELDNENLEKLEESLEKDSDEELNNGLEEDLEEDSEEEKKKKENVAS